MPECVHAYYDFQDELITQEQVVFKGALLIIPVAMRKEMVHTTHTGTEGCIRRARNSMYWVQMATELKEYMYL